MRHTVSLRSNRDFKRMYARAGSAPGACLVVFVSKNRLDVSRLGLTVSTKMGGAVQRNRMRRRMKEAYRLVEDKLRPGYDIVMVARFGLEKASFELIQAEIIRLFYKAAERQKVPRGGGGRKAARK